MQNYNQYLWSVAWADFDFELSNLLVAKKSRIRMLIVGLKFFGTNPSFIKEFYQHQGVRFLEQKKGTYHPKLYLFRNSKTDWELLIGSGNFTASAFKGNTEAAILVSSSDKSLGNIYESIIEFINEQWRNGKILNEDYVKEYRKRKRKVKMYVPKLPTKGSRHPVFETTWKEYLADLKQTDYKSRIDLLNWVKEQFRNDKKFHKIDLNKRKSIAGFGSGEEDVVIGCFGTTNARGNFMHAVIKKPQIISHALNQIPSRGEVTKTDYQSFIKVFKRVSDENELACSTRLLCLWRPDYFVNVNGKNKKALCKELQINKSKVNYETYWDLIVQPFINSDWGKQKKSMSKSEAEIYNYRVALLDCLYYTWE